MRKRKNEPDRAPKRERYGHGEQQKAPGSLPGPFVDRCYELDPDLPPIRPKLVSRS